MTIPPPNKHLDRTTYIYLNIYSRRSFLKEQYFTNSIFGRIVGTAKEYLKK